MTAITAVARTARRRDCGKSEKRIGSKKKAGVREVVVSVDYDAVNRLWGGLSRRLKDDA